MRTDFWEIAARRDPLWAVLSDPSKRGRQWDMGAFFETGAREISLLLYQLRRLARFPRIDRALDFGCGVGRLTEPLAATFAEAIGVDASPTMIDLARRLSRHPRARYVLNQSPRLEAFGDASFDFVYSDIVLQHLDPDAAAGYVIEFLRLLKPRAIAVFQLPSHKRSPAERPRQPQRMPSQAYAAALRVVDGPPRQMAPQATALVTVELRNASTTPWNQLETGVIRAGNHWRSPQGAMLIQDDGRARLPEIVEPETPLLLDIPIQAPPEPGQFVCEFDLVHEGITWFGDAGSRLPVQRTVSVVAAGADDRPSPSQAETVTGGAAEFPDIDALLGPADLSEIPPFPMHGVPRDHVLALLAAHGGEPFLIEDDERGGPEWQGYRYFVEKRL
jgi:SAM-dependent methyltransferase